MSTQAPDATAGGSAPPPDSASNEQPSGSDVSMTRAVVLLSLAAAATYVIGFWFPRGSFCLAPLVAYAAIRLAYRNRKMTGSKKLGAIVFGLLMSTSLLGSALEKSEVETEFDKMNATIEGFLAARKDGKGGSEHWVFDNAATSKFIVMDHSLVSSRLVPDDDPVAGWEIHHVSAPANAGMSAEQDWLFCAARFDRPSVSRPDARIGWKIVYMAEAGNSSRNACQKIGAAVAAANAENGDAQVQAMAAARVANVLSMNSNTTEPCDGWRSMADYVDKIKSASITCQPSPGKMLCATSPVDSTDGSGLLSTQIALTEKNGHISGFTLVSVIGPLATIFSDSRFSQEYRANYLALFASSVEEMILNIPKTWEVTNEHFAGTLVDRRIKSAFLNAIGKVDTTSDFGNGELTVSFRGEDLRDLIGDDMPTLKPGVRVLVAVGRCPSSP